MRKDSQPTTKKHSKKGINNGMDFRSDNRLRTLSLFSGIGGIDLGLKPWCRTICYCEIDPYAIGVLTKNMAKGTLDVAPIWDNVKTLGQAQLKRFSPIECIIAGFPCQDISGLGKRAGIKRGTRSGLFYEIMRIARLVKPQIIFLENVHRLLARGMDIVLRELSKNGYNAVWRVLSAEEIGYPHRRNRVWIFAYPSSRRFNRNVVLRAAYAARNKDQAFRGQDPKKFKLFIGNMAPAKWRSEGFNNPSPLFVRSDNGLPGQLDKFRLRCLGNAVVPACAGLAFKLLLNECLVRRRKQGKNLIAL